eukprot:6192064-Pleurochrysis_carterae.AAC.1
MPEPHIIFSCTHARDWCTRTCAPSQFAGSMVGLHGQLGACMGERATSRRWAHAPLTSRSEGVAIAC